MWITNSQLGVENLQAPVESGTEQRFTVTPRFITKGQSYRAGWLERQFEILGFDYPPPPGWRQVAVGRSISLTEAREFLSLRVGKPGEETPTL